ncbi:efflux RND transporter periplasmic adaptor subunit [Paracoccus sp. 1_MG-2023]|uniref:efflux RND transporter periplasmic adaptor subunit n=1 Tax=unclassified Paracoccus (in: a-proteobacteria) TaxID=2688777 RepID=UPI001C095FD7|nr:MULTISPECIES: efflux RND transporter periplasmic adaptor subunit [unclassified Paracoccus (in: a-proteobacteria)]MBU2956852.1 efflux RND transporter periplasmic adaptor subunit [Paracoccus sp. C2R09]MDO6670237.1 efflux RND transporter periplasmic adaptor subunit [Paracoccus sp. 1_MG-2023]
MRIATCLALGLLAAAPAAALGLPEWLVGAPEAQEPAPPRPVVSVLVRDADADTGWIPGLIQSRNQVQLGFQALGRMTDRPVDLGDRVAQGDLLAQLSTEDLEANTRAARAALDAAEVQQRTAAATLERTQALAARNVSSNAQLEQAQQAATAADAAVEQARSELLQAEDAEGNTRMTAPFAGVISAIYEAPGTVVSAGTPVLQLSGGQEIEVVIDLPEQSLIGVEPGARFTVWHRNDPDLQVTATLDRIDPVADSATRTRRLYLTLPAEEPFRLGALVRVRFGTADAPVLSLPIEALIDTDEGRFVWRVDRQGDNAQVQRVPVEAAAPYRGLVSITSGLETGDEIVVRGVNSLTEGQAVARRLEP